MARILWCSFALVVVSACTPSQIVKDYSQYSGCPEDKVEVTNLERAGLSSNISRYRVSGCGNGAEYVCRDDAECSSPMITVARRHAKQFGCRIDYVTVEYLDGGSWRASGCKHEMTYHCVETKEVVTRCVAETDERRPGREGSSRE